MMDPSITGTILADLAKVATGKLTPAIMAWVVSAFAKT